MKFPFVKPDEEREKDEPKKGKWGVEFVELEEPKEEDKKEQNG